jgi:hypothetical protein
MAEAINSGSFNANQLEAFFDRLFKLASPPFASLSPSLPLKSFLSVQLAFYLSRCSKIPHTLTGLESLAVRKYRKASE